MLIKKDHIKFLWTELDGPGSYGQNTDLDITLIEPRHIDHIPPTHPNLSNDLKIFE